MQILTKVYIIIIFTKAYIKIIFTKVYIQIIVTKVYIQIIVTVIGINTANCLRYSGLPLAVTLIPPGMVRRMLTAHALSKTSERLVVEMESCALTVLANRFIQGLRSATECTDSCSETEENSNFSVAHRKVGAG